jgi:hypothetical protein
MRNEFSGNRSGPARMPWSYRRRGAGGGGRPGTGRIRYAHGGAPLRVEPYCTVPQGGPQGPAEPHGGGAGAAAGGGAGAGAGGGADVGGDLRAAPWLAEPPVGGRHGDLWVLVCGGIAAAAAFGAAFVASGGVASHPAAPGATMPAAVSHAAARGARMPTVVSQACPAPSAGPAATAGPAPAAGPTP